MCVGVGVSVLNVMSLTYQYFVFPGLNCLARTHETVCSCQCKCLFTIQIHMIHWQIKLPPRETSFSLPPSLSVSWAFGEILHIYMQIHPHNEKNTAFYFFSSLFTLLWLGWNVFSVSRHVFFWTVHRVLHFAPHVRTWRLSSFECDESLKARCAMRDNFAIHERNSSQDEICH